MNVVILIPAYNPDNTLLEVVDGLQCLGFTDFIIVNDGSKKECAGIFAELGKNKFCHVLHHAVNGGKGRALKTGFNYFLLTFPGCVGVVTADADGQHKPKDILDVARTLEEHQDKLVMGCRKMGKEVPFRSLFGNVLTRFVFSFAVGQKISDTQSGLRGIPAKMIPDLINTRGERYEFEINMLILARKKSITIIEKEIETIYIEANRSSHFNPLFDSMKIYFQLLRYTFSSLVASFFDFIVFTITFNISAKLLVSILVARLLVGSLIHYMINRRLVFHSKARIFSTLMKYYLALGVMGFLSYLLINLSLKHLGLGVIPAKIAVESLLFAFNFLIQRDFVFTSYEE